MSNQMEPRRNFFFALSLFLAATLLVATFASAAPAAPHEYIVYVGTYTQDGGTGKGIYAFRYDAKTARVNELRLAAETTNPTWFAVHPNGRFLYAVSEVGNYQGANSGGIMAFAIDRANGKLTLLNEVASRGAGPCNLTFDRAGKFVLVANYSGGSLAVFPILADGKLGPATDVVQHSGHGPNPARQEGPHPHSIVLTPDNRFAIVNDLGLDELLVYKFDSTTGKLTPNDPPFTKVDPGSGPRHLALSGDGKFAYVVNEMGRTVTAFCVDLSAGVLHTLQSISTVPSNFKGRNDDAEIEMVHSGKFLYASNRGDDSIAIFAVSRTTGKLQPIGTISTGGKEPRTFEIDPLGKLLFAANRDSGNIVIFRIDAKTGQLTPTGQVLHVPWPVCIKFLAVK